MGWGASILAALIVAAIGAFAAFFMAYAAVDWLRIPAREGESGYFVVFMGLFGIMGGLAVGFVVSRIFGGPGLIGFAQGLGISVAVLLAVIGAAGAYAWMQSDPAPRVAGREVEIEFEMRGYPGMPLDPAAAPDTSYADGPVAVWLGSWESGSRYSRIDLSRAHQENNGRWIVPGTLPLFSSRRQLYFGLRAGSTSAFIAFDAPAPSSAQNPQWSDWLTAPADAKTPEATGPDGFAIRYRYTLAPPEDETGR